MSNALFAPYAAIAKNLGKTGLSVTPHFLDALEVKATRNDFDALEAAGSFNQGSIGRGLETQVETSIRKNKICWIDRNLPTEAQAELWLKLDLLKRAFNQILFLGLNEFEGHYASYPSGGYYKRHLDSFATKPSRLVSIILYLNHSWVEADGGKLRVYQECDQHIDVNPVGGTLACFLSRESEHEVLESHQFRYSFTGWFKREI